MGGKGFTQLFFSWRKPKKKCEGIQFAVGEVEKKKKKLDLLT